jgi:serine protease Do
MRYRILSVTAAAFAVALLAAGAGRSAGGDKPKEKPAAAAKPIEIKGELTATDPPDKENGGPSKIHKAKLKKGTPYVIDLMSKDFDSFLRLLSPRGDQIAENDDGGDFLNSRLRFTPEEDGEYQLVATSLNRKTGKYVLRVRAVAPLVGKKLKVGDDVQDRLAQDDPSPPGIDKRAKVYNLAMTADKTYVFDLVSKQFDAYLILQDPAGQTIAHDDDGGEGLNSRLRFRCTADGTYTIIATGLGNPLGEFELRVRED